VCARFVGVGGEHLVGNEMPIALDGETQPAAHNGEIVRADVAELLVWRLPGFNE
jgi:hypothetical protein